MDEEVSLERACEVEFSYGVGSVGVRAVSTRKQTEGHVGIHLWEL